MVYINKVGTDTISVPTRVVTVTPAILLLGKRRAILRPPVAYVKPQLRLRSQKLPQKFPQGRLVRP